MKVIFQATAQYLLHTERTIKFHSGALNSREEERNIKYSSSLSYTIRVLSIFVSEAINGGQIQLTDSNKSK